MSEQPSVPLHPLEKNVLSVLKDQKDWVDFGSLVSASGLMPDQVRRAVSWLESKKLITSREENVRTLTAQGFPAELLLVQRIGKNGMPLDDLRKTFKSDQEFAAALGNAKSQGWVQVAQKDGRSTVSFKDEGNARRHEDFFGSMTNGETDPESIPPEYKAYIERLIVRNIIRKNEVKSVSLRITDEGVAAARGAASEDWIERVTPEVTSKIRLTGVSPKLRPIDVSAPSSVFFPGRRHPVKEFINEVREVYLSMGFSEIAGDSIQSSFWNFDALFIPQDHPGREMQDTFYLAGLTDDKIERSGIVDHVASTHENGWTTGSRGWRYRWRTEEARRLLLRTHNTVLTIKALSESKDRDARIFAVNKVYRNENLDYKHLAEFHQMDGIIVGEGLNVRHLMGFLKEFYKKLGMKDVKLWPTFFPYTEPSLQIMGYSEIAKGWIELGGSGVFRPEVTLPLGVNVPVLAWGPGIERLMLLRYGLDDIRKLYDSDLAWLRKRVEFASSST
jgi:phenylalanyl-tRNA synthetase alpha chain